MSVESPAGGRPDPEGLAAARAVAEELAPLYGPRLRRVLLYGSRARGDYQWGSDADVLVVLDRVDQADNRYRGPVRRAATRAFMRVGPAVGAIAVAEQETAAPGRDRWLVNALRDGVEVYRSA